MSPFGSCTVNKHIISGFKKAGFNLSRLNLLYMSVYCFESARRLLSQQRCIHNQQKKGCTFGKNALVSENSDDFLLGERPKLCSETRTYSVQTHVMTLMSYLFTKEVYFIRKSRNKQISTRPCLKFQVKMLFLPHQET